MLHHRNLTEQHIFTILTHYLSPLIYPETVPLSIAVHHVGGEPIPYSSAVARSFQRVSEGALWGAPWDTSWFRFGGSIPASWIGYPYSALIDLGHEKPAEGFTCEGLVWFEGTPRGAVNVNRQELPLMSLVQPGDEFEFYVEAAANPMAAMSHGNALLAPDYQGTSLFVLRKAVLARLDPSAYGLYQDTLLLYELMTTLPLGSQRRASILAGLNLAMNAVQIAAMPLPEIHSRYLAPLLAMKNSGTTHTVSALGHAHIDIAWLWPLRETIRKCARTFSSVLELMDSFPTFQFACSQAQQYAWMKQHYPSIFERIKQAITRGQWQPVGSQWVECDCNIPGGESLIRQLLHGKRFFREEFGIETCDMWLPDAFGYSAALPQVMIKAGISLFMSTKISWNQFNEFPFHSFLWEGLDGSRIFSHFPPAQSYEGKLLPQELITAAERFKEKDRASKSLYLFGYSDGGGGPTHQQLHWLQRLADLEGVPPVIVESVNSFCTAAAHDIEHPPVWVGELYFELHRGTYTTQAKVKRNNRLSEVLLHEIEFLSSLAAAVGVADVLDLPVSQPPCAVYETPAYYPAERYSTVRGALDRAWKLVLLNQFHDIIPGSSIHWVYQDADRDYQVVKALLQEARAVIEARLLPQVCTTNYVHPLFVMNSLGHPRAEIVNLDNDSSVYVTAPGLGCSITELHRQINRLPPEVQWHPVSVIIDGQECIVDNGLVRLRLDAAAMITSIYDLRVDRELISKDAQANSLYLYHDFPNRWDAWDIDIGYQELAELLGTIESVSIIHSSPLMTIVRIRRVFSHSQIEQDLIVRAGTARIDFRTKVEWREKHKLLRVQFPVALRAMQASYSIQFGHIERPTHYNTSWDLARFEVCAHKWVDLSEPNYGVALLSDCKYGFSVHENIIGMSLLRSPTAPDPLADEGMHEFTYALFPHQEDLTRGKVIEEAYNFNYPLRYQIVESHTGSLSDSFSLGSIDRAGIVVEAIKMAEDGDGVIIRLYESFGCRGKFLLRLTAPVVRVWLCDMLERVLEVVTFVNNAFEYAIKPFEILTFKITFESQRGTGSDSPGRLAQSKPRKD